MFVSRSMTQKLITIVPETGVFEAQEKMAANGIRHLPVVEADKSHRTRTLDVRLAADGSARIQHIEGLRTAQYIVIGRNDQAPGQARLGLGLV